MAYTDHELLAAVRVARLLDPFGNDRLDADLTYPQTLSQGEHRTHDLIGGEELLSVVGLVQADEGKVIPAAASRVLAALPDQQAVAALRRMLADQNDRLDRSKIGDAGEQVVAETCRAELTGYGRDDLADAVQQVSLIDDSLGYDIDAPTVGSSPRMLEVKTSGTPHRSGTFRFFLSRNEYEVGRRNPTRWALVACRYDPAAEAASVTGWCRASALEPYLPHDNVGRWTEAELSLPVTALLHGVPSAV